MPEKLILVDGHSLMYRAFHALPLLDNGEGLYTNAIYGFFGMLFSALEKEQPDYLAIAFDLPTPTFRHNTFTDYKAGRAPTPDELRPQFDHIKTLLKDMHIAIVSKEGFEADDILGTLSLKAEQRGIDTLLITGDRDAFQLASDHTSILYTKRGVTDTERVTPAFIYDQYGVTPPQLIDMKGLMGDKSDNIPGVPGVGEKTASKLIAQYGTLENALDHADADQKGALRQRLLDNIDQAKLSKYLATIDRNAPIDWDDATLRLGDLSQGREGFLRLKLRSLLPKLDQLTRAPKPIPAPVESPKPAIHPLLQTTDPDAIAHFAKSAAHDRMAIAIGQNLSVALSNGDQILIPLGGDLLNPGLSESEALAPLRPLLENASTKIIHSTKAMDAVLSVEHIALGGHTHDLMLAAYVLDAQRKSYRLDALLSEETNYSTDAPAAAMLSLAEKQTEQMASDGLTGVYQDIELPLARVLMDMEKHGFLVDDTVLTRLGQIYDQRIGELTRSIHAHAGYQVNINSPKQLSELLYDETKLGLRGVKKTKSGFSTDADALEQLIDSHPIVPEILEYRKYAKLKSTYIDALLKLRDREGRIHTSFDQVATATGRISSQEPNLQNIPVRTELGREIREAFIAPKGCVLVDADYSQIELRVLAHMSGDAVMQEAFRLGQDIHQRTAAEVYQVPIDKVTKQMRSNAKAVNFGIVYGISDFGLARNIGVSRAEAKQFIERYLKRYPGIKRFMDDQITEGKMNGYVKTLFGRRRYLPELASSSHNTRSFGERAAMNSPIQGTAADIIKMAMVRVDEAIRREKLNARLILQVHDELIIEAPEAESAACETLLRREMEQVCALSVPLCVDVSVGRNWNECK